VSRVRYDDVGLRNLVEHPPPGEIPLFFPNPGPQERVSDEEFLLFLHFLLGHLEGFQVLGALEEIIRNRQKQEYARHHHAELEGHDEADGECLDDAHVERPHQVGEVLANQEKRNGADGGDFEQRLPEIHQALLENTFLVKKTNRVRVDPGKIRFDGLSC